MAFVGNGTALAGSWCPREIGNTGDPITSLQSSVAMSRDLANARLLTIHGYGHTEYANPSTCATSFEVSYLLTGTLPSAHCMAIDWSGPA